jgi:hypothetical protein
VWKTLVLQEKELKMKTTKKLLTSLYVVSLLSATSAQAADVDNIVKYGEKYLCDIQTVDQKNYSLELEWSAEPKTYSQFPEWHNILKYSLNENGKGIDRGYFSNLGFGSNGLDFTFNWNFYLFSGVESRSTRVGTNFYTVDIKLAKNYDKDAKTVLTVESFKSTAEKSYYRLYEPKSILLNIQSSTCTVAPVSKD